MSRRAVVTGVLAIVIPIGLFVVFRGTAVSPSSIGEVLADNGFVEVGHGQILRAVYLETTSQGLFEKTDLRPILCQPSVGVGNTTIPQIGRDDPVLIEGGCETDAQGRRVFGLPDRHMDAGERIFYHFGFASFEPDDLHDVEASLRCVLTDTDSPEDCVPTSSSASTCPDPTRAAWRASAAASPTSASSSMGSRCTSLPASAPRRRSAKTWTRCWRSPTVPSTRPRNRAATGS